MIDPELQARVERKLDLNERLVWAGKPVPWAFSKKTLGAMLFGIPWSFITAIVMSGFIYGFFFTEDGRGEPLALKIGICIFFVPFVCIGLGMLGAPLWCRLRTSRWVYAVTDKRALLIGLFHTRDWRALPMTGGTATAPVARQASTTSPPPRRPPPNPPSAL